MTEAAGDGAKRYPMRGIVLFSAWFGDEAGWSFTSVDSEGLLDSMFDPPEWKSPTCKNVFLYTDWNAALREHEDDGFIDSITLRLTGDGNAYVIQNALSRAEALVTIPADAEVSTLSWELFRASEATVRTVAKLDNRLLTTPIQKLLGTFDLRVYVRGQGSRAYDPNLPILNLNAFSKPPMEKMAAKHGIAIKRPEFLDATREPTTRVSRAPGWWMRYGMKALDETRRYEMMEEVPELLNHATSAAQINWLLGEIRSQPRRLSEGAVRGSQEVFLSNREYIRSRLGEINSSAVRARMEAILGPVRPAELGWDFDPEELD